MISGAQLTLFSLSYMTDGSVLGPSMSFFVSFVATLVLGEATRGTTLVLLVLLHCCADR